MICSQRIIYAAPCWPHTAQSDNLPTAHTVKENSARDPGKSTWNVTEEQCPWGQSKILVACGFCQCTSTKNLARAIYGLSFVPRFVTFSKCNNLRTEIRSKIVELLDQYMQHSFIDLVRLAGLKRASRTGQSLPLPSRLKWSLARYFHRRGHIPLFQLHPQSPQGARYF